MTYAFRSMAFDHAFNRILLRAVLCGYTLKFEGDKYTLTSPEGKSWNFDGDGEDLPVANSPEETERLQLEVLGIE